MGDRFGLLHQTLVRDDSGDEVALEGPLSVDRLGSEQHLQRDSGATGVDQSHDPTVAMVEAAPGFERSEHRSVRSNPDVTGESSLEPARERPAVDRPDDRL